jgi:hypothetical protein
MHVGHLFVFLILICTVRQVTSSNTSQDFIDPKEQIVTFSIKSLVTLIIEGVRGFIGKAMQFR